MHHHQNGWGGSPPPWPGHHPSSSASPLHHDGQQPTWLIARMMDGIERLLTGQARIEARLEHGDERMDRHEIRITSLEQAPPPSPPSPTEPPPSRTERLAVSSLAWLLPGAALWATGSADTVVKLVEAVVRLAAVLK